MRGAELIEPGSESESYVVVTVWSLCCTLALLAVLILALVSASIPSGS
jgi:hypothetical protein